MRSNLISHMLVGIVSCAVAATTFAAALPAPTPSRPLQQEIPKDTSAWRRDPFFHQPKALGPSSNVPRNIPAGALRPMPSNISLQGIMQANNNFHALINGQIVKTGDKIDGFLIKNVDRYKVTVQQETSRQVFDIYQGKIERGMK